MFHQSLFCMHCLVGHALFYSYHSISDVKTSSIVIVCITGIYVTKEVNYLMPINTIASIISLFGCNVTRTVITELTPLSRGHVSHKRAWAVLVQLGLVK